MHFISPLLFWAGLGAVSAPILIHLLNRQKYKRIRWAAMEFLLLAFKRTRRRMQIEHLIILILRCLTMLMLGMVLAQPLLGAFVSGSRDVYVLVDDSYSMNYKSGEDTTFKRGQDALTQIITNLNPKDDIHVVMLSEVVKRRRLGGAVEPKFEATDGTLNKNDIERIKSEIPNLKASDMRTDMLAGLEEMYQLIFGASNKEQLTKELYIITDFQRNSWGLAPIKTITGTDSETTAPGEVDVAAVQKKFRDLFADLAQSRDGMEAKVVLVDVGEENSDQKKENFVIQNVTVDQKELVTGSFANFEVTVRNNGFTERNAVVEFYVDEAVTALTKTISNLKPNESASVTFRKRFTDTDAGAHYVTAVVNDELVADSAYYLGFKVRQGLKVLLVDGDKQPDVADIRSETWILRYILCPQSPDETPTENQQRLYILPPVVTDRLRGAKDESYDNYQIVMIANLKITESSPTDEQIELLENYVRNGGKLVIWVGDNVNATEYNQRLFQGGKGIMPAELGETKGDRYDDTKEMKDKTRFLTGELSHEIMRKFLVSKILERADESPDFSKYFMMKVPPKDTGVVARFDVVNTFSNILGEKLPAIVEKYFPNNGGRVILVNTTADGEWNNMTISPKDAIYVVLVHEIVLYLMRSERSNLLLGQPIERVYTLENRPDTTLLRIKSPNEDTSKVVSDSKVDELGDGRFALKAAVKDTYAAGPYMMEYTGSGLAESKDYFGVNVELAESDLTRVEPDKLRGVYPEFKVEKIIKPGDKIEALGINTSSNMWLYALIMMIVFLALESGLALLFGKRSSGA